MRNMRHREDKHHAWRHETDKHQTQMGSRHTWLELLMPTGTDVQHEMEVCSLPLGGENN